MFVLLVGFYAFENLPEIRFFGLDILYYRRANKHFNFLKVDRLSIEGLNIEPLSSIRIFLLLRVCHNQHQPHYHGVFAIYDHFIQYDKM